MQYRQIKFESYEMESRLSMLHNKFSFPSKYRVKMTHKGGAGNIFVVNAFPVGHSGEQKMLTAH